jgi:toxin YoeB
MKKTWSDEAWDEYVEWQRIDKKTVNKINELLKDIDRHPFEGLGKPEPLKHELNGYWSRHINDEHRLVYQVQNDSIYIARSKYHYKK